MNRGSLICFALILINFKVSADQVAQWFSQQNYIPIKVEKIITGHDVVRATLNGVEGFFVVDTGAVSVMNETSLGKYKIRQKLSSHTAAGAAGPIDIDSYAIESLELAGMSADLNKIASTDLNAVMLGLLNTSGKLMDGIIGMDVLKNLHAQLDIANQRIWVKPSAHVENNVSLSLPGHYSAIPLSEIHFEEMDFSYLILDVSVNNSWGKLLVDSGSSKTILNQSDFDYFNIDEADVNSTRSTAGAGGAFQIKETPVKSIGLAKRSYDIDRVLAANLSAVVDFVSEPDNTIINGVIGQNFFIAYDAIIDVGGNRLLLKTP